MRFLATCLAACAALTANAEVYHWIDDKGAVNITSKPPAKRAVDATAIGQRTWSPQPVIDAPVADPAPSARTNEPASASPVAAKAQVTMYMAPWCGYCRQAKAHLAARKIAYREIDIDSSAAARNEFRNAGGRGVPLILVGNERISGFTRESLEALLRRGGY